MTNYIHDRGDPVETGSHGETDYVFASGEPVPNSGQSTLVFESGTGIGGGLIIDDFEDGDLSEYFGDTGGHSVSGSAAYEGSYGLATPDSARSIFSTSGLDAYPAAGDTFECRINHNGGTAHTQFHFGVQDSNNYYSVHPDSRPGTTENGIQIRKNKNGSLYIKNEKETGNIPNSEWMRAEVEWGSGGLITFNLYDSGDNLLGTIDMNDTEWTSGGIGWGMAGAAGQNVYYDFARKVA